eukprot:gene53437-71435_t
MGGTLSLAQSGASVFFHMAKALSRHSSIHSGSFFFAEIK